MYKNKKGQFFLIATLVILSIILGFGVVYNSTTISKTDYKSAHLAEEIKYEAVQVIDTDFLNNKINDISTDLISLTEFYSIKNPTTNIFLIYENDLEFNCYNSLNICPPVDNIVDPSTIDIPFGDSSSTVNLINTSAHDVYIITKKETGNERFISKV